MEYNSNKLGTIEVDGITYEILEKKPVQGKSYAAHLYIQHGKNKFIVTQFGKDVFSKVHPLTNQHEQ